MTLSNTQYHAASALGIIAGFNDLKSDLLITGLTSGFAQDEFYSQERHAHQVTSFMRLGLEFLNYSMDPLNNNTLTNFAINALAKAIVLPWVADQIHHCTHNDNFHIHTMGEFWPGIC